MESYTQHPSNNNDKYLVFERLYGLFERDNTTEWNPSFGSVEKEKTVSGTVVVMVVISAVLMCAGFVLIKNKNTI